ncbi:MAG: PQQ-dependent sugar dehydrogenase [Methylococcaceae bacterium]
MKRLMLGLLMLLTTRAPDLWAYQSEGMTYEVERLIKQSDVIWGFDFLPDGDILFTERGGMLKRLNPRTGRITVMEGAPAVAAGGQGGLLDVRLDPDFAQTHWVYLTYSEPLTANLKTTAWGRGRLDGDQLKDFRRLFSATATNDKSIHFGARIEFDGQNHLFVSVGERDERHKAQDLSVHNGKILRFNRDGTVPADNPLYGNNNTRPEVWSWGHRNPQGLAFNPMTQTLWSAEFGPMGGDEINQIRPGLNYGWPVITHGREYYGPGIGEGTEKPGMEPPVAYYVPSISPSGIGFYTGNRFPGWQGNLFVATLSGQHLRRLVIQDDRVVKQEVLLNDLGWRFRQVRTGPDGYLYFSTDDGRLARLVSTPH